MSQVQIIAADDSCPLLPLIDGEGTARAVIWPGVGATQRSMHLIELPPGGKTIRMQHPMEAVYYVLEGATIAADMSDSTRQEASTGAMIFVEPNTPYVISADGGPTRLVGGPCPPDETLYEGLIDD